MKFSYRILFAALFALLIGMAFALQVNQAGKDVHSAVKSYKSQTAKIDTTIVDSMLTDQFISR